MYDAGCMRRNLVRRGDLEGVRRVEREGIVHDRELIGEAPKRHAPTVPLRDERRMMYDDPRTAHHTPCIIRRASCTMHRSAMRPPFLCAMNGVWCMMIHVPCIIHHNAKCTVSDVWCMMYDAWRMAYDA